LRIDAADGCTWFEIRPIAGPSQFFYSREGRDAFSKQVATERFQSTSNRFLQHLRHDRHLQAERAPRGTGLGLTDLSNWRALWVQSSRQLEFGVGSSLMHSKASLEIGQFILQGLNDFSNVIVVERVTSLIREIPDDAYGLHCSLSSSFGEPNEFFPLQ
jgi:hypothetical protein